MSKRTIKLRKKISQLIAREIASGTPEDEIIGALEIVKCNVAIAAAQATIATTKKKDLSGN